MVLAQALKVQRKPDPDRSTLQEDGHGHMIYLNSAVCSAPFRQTHTWSILMRPVGVSNKAVPDFFQKILCNEASADYASICFRWRPIHLKTAVTALHRTKEARGNDFQARILPPHVSA